MGKVINGKKILKNKKGQFAIETVLMMLVLFGLFFTLTKKLNEFGILEKLVKEPWAQVAGMIESGVWAAPAKARASHPNQTDRGVSFNPQGGG